MRGRKREHGLWSVWPPPSWLLKPLQPWPSGPWRCSSMACTWPLMSALWGLQPGLTGWRFLDPIVGLLGAFVIGRWSVLLMQQSARVLLDMEDDPSLADDIRKTLEEDLSARVSDMHLWRLGPGHRGLIVSVISPVPRSADEIKYEIRRRHSGLSHV